MRGAKVYVVVMNILPILALVLMRAGLWVTGIRCAWICLILYPLAVYAGLFIFKDITRCGMSALRYKRYKHGEESLDWKYWGKVLPVIGLLVYFLIAAFMLYYSVFEIWKIVLMGIMLFVALMLPFALVFKNEARPLVYIVSAQQFNKR